MDNVPGFDTLSKMSDQDLTNLFGVRDFFTYELDFSGILAAGGTAQGTFNVQSDSNFLWQYGCYSANIAHAAQTNDTRVFPEINVLIQDSSSGRQLMSAPVPVTSIFGYGSLPFLLPTARFFRAQTQVVVSVTNNSAVSVLNLQLSFIGTKFFKFAQSL